MLEPVTEALPPDGGLPHPRPLEPAAPTPATTPPDLLLVERARGKETRAFETLMQRYNQRLFRIARSIVPDEDSAESVVQEAYLIAFGDIERYEPTGKFGAWLARLTFNQALAQRRTVPRGVADSSATLASPRGIMPSRTEAGSDGTVRDAAAAGTDIGAGGGSSSSSAGGIGAGAADGATATPGMRQILEQAIDGLPEVFRTVFVLRTIEGISGIETAACLGLNETTVRTRLFRAQKRLRVDWARRPPPERNELFELGSARSERIITRVLERLGTP